MKFYGKVEKFFLLLLYLFSLFFYFFIFGPILFFRFFPVFCIDGLNNQDGLNFILFLLYFYNNKSLWNVMFCFSEIPCVF